MAISKENVNEVKRIIGDEKYKKALTFEKGNKNNPLLSAVLKGNSEIVKTLLSHEDVRSQILYKNKDNYDRKFEF